jgi:hypothetical protein
MTEEEFDAFLETALDQLIDKQSRAVERYQLGSHSSFWFDQQAGTIQFRGDHGVPLIEGTVTPIGTFSKSTQTWHWAWANEAFLHSLREKAAALKVLESRTGYELFSTPVIDADENMADELSAMAVTVLDAETCYRFPAKHVLVYLALDLICRVS